MSESASFSNVTASYPQTSQSFASLLTGNYPWYHGVWGIYTALPDNVVTIAEELYIRGYHTYAVVTNANIYPIFNFNQGFEKYLPLEKDDPVSVTDAALNLVSKGLERPFFLWIHYMDPHGPYDPPEKYVEIFDSDSQYYRDLNPENYIKKYRGATPTPKEAADALVRYDGEIRFQDLQFKRLFCELSKKGYLKNSILIFTSDHGESFGHHGYYFNHGPSPYMELQVPLCFYSPGLILPKKSDQPVELIDLAPTILSLIGIKKTNMQLVGVDLSYFLTGKIGEFPFPRTYAMGCAHVTDQKGYPQFFILRSSDYELIVNKLDSIKRIKSLDRVIEFSNSIFQFRGQGIELYNIQNNSFERDSLYIREKEIADSMLHALGGMLLLYSIQENYQIPVSRKDLDPETMEKLKSLGYINK